MQRRSAEERRGECPPNLAASAKDCNEQLGLVYRPPDLPGGLDGGFVGGLPGVPGPVIWGFCGGGLPGDAGVCGGRGGFGLIVGPPGGVVGGLVTMNRGCGGCGGRPGSCGDGTI